MFVGDVNQSIYEWRGASPDIMGSIPQMFPGTKTLYLGNNYRSTGALVEFFKEILPVDNGLASHMRTANPAGESPTFTHYADDYQEAMQVLRRVTDPENTAIIARTNRQIFRYQQACFNMGLKCKILGRKMFWDQPEIKNLLSLAKNSKMPEGYTAPMVLKALVIQHRLLEKYKFSGNPLEPDPADNINSLYKISAKHQTIKELLDAIRKMNYGSKSKNTKCLTLTSGHMAKGKEWKHVFVVGVTEGILPHNKATHTEEARLWFVMASRAAETLHVTFYRQPSLFLDRYRDKVVRYVPEVVAA
jgi:DNA helicase-2/ATP-dependent DNA helicase PcrA